MNRPIHFLVFFNRSGSTLLAKKLNEYKDLAVGIEVRFKKDIEEKFIVNSEYELNNWLDCVFSDNKYRYWNINKNELKNKLLKFTFPISYKDFLTCSLDLFFKNDPAKILIHKNRGYFRNIIKSKIIFPGSKYIFIQRDPRAIFNSLKKSLDSYTTNIMADNIVGFALWYKNIQKKICFYITNDELKKYIVIIRYEDLLLNEQKELNKILEFFNVSNTKSERLEQYYEKIPENQKYLHENITKENLTDRINAWKRELPLSEIYFLNKVIKKDIVKNGYRIENINFFYLEKKTELIINLLKYFYMYFPKAIIKSMLYSLKFRIISKSFNE
jgi:hypothetical protein